MFLDLLMGYVTAVATERKRKEKKQKTRSKVTGRHREGTPGKVLRSVQKRK